MEVRLQKLLSQWGIASRRQAEELITKGQVQLNGHPACLGQKADPEIDQIRVKGQLCNPVQPPQHSYWLLHKPKGVVSTCRDPRNRPTVLDLLSSIHRQGLHPVGRLDASSTGALILTNDGEFTFRLTHPRFHVPKTYQVCLQGNPSTTALQQWRQGLELDGKQTQPAQIRIVKPYQRTTDSTEIEVILQEGKNRQIRRIAEQLGYPVRQLHRTHIGSVALQSPSCRALPVGQYRPLAPAEIDHLWRITDKKSRACSRRSTLS
ncbi:MAG: rRNA pseudouridine synthase [Acaryochloridaceae cyanobacterium SU_2_1]|nr:rRNA pseudouridine synthase [Acaryochloridaceae cyanobacterium SU_2_1]NJM95545.1 rRNA pseudouridine synthase [Acaryochloridaceae cyanobacterium CSU_5_19]